MRQDVSSKGSRIGPKARGHQSPTLRVLPVLRYLGEALEIRDAADKGEELLNSRGEWGRVQLKRLALVSD